MVIMSDSNSTHLLLSSASLQDSGNYQCVARNHPVDMTRYRAQDIGVTVLRELEEGGEGRRTREGGRWGGEGREGGRWGGEENKRGRERGRGGEQEREGGRGEGSRKSLISGNTSYSVVVLTPWLVKPGKGIGYIQMVTLLVVVLVVTTSTGQEAVG